MKHLLILLLLAALSLAPLRAAAQDLQAEPFDQPRWSLSTNLLSWATLAPNLGAEVYWGSRWSATVDGSFGLWGFGTDKAAFQTWSAGGEVRYWLQARRYGFRRTWVGLAVRGGEFDENFFTDGRRGNALLAGATVGYRFILPGRHWRVDTSLGLGYTRFDYDRYHHNTRFDVWELDGHTLHQGFGLTHLNVALVYLF